MEQGVQLYATISPSNAVDKNITWSSSNAAIASVNSNGYVSFNAPGSVIIYATSSNGKVATCTVTVILPQGQQVFTTSGIFTVPDHATSVDAFLVGGGGSGYMAGGGSGYTATYKGITVSPGQQISVVIGAGGLPAYYTGTDGGNSLFGSYSANGGSGARSSIIAGAGGSGGGAATQYGKTYCIGGNGGGGMMDLMDL